MIVVQRGLHVAAAYPANAHHRQEQGDDAEEDNFVKRAERAMRQKYWHVSPFWTDTGVQRCGDARVIEYVYFTPKRGSSCGFSRSTHGKTKGAPLNEYAF
jgi:hypothetical protein